MPGDFHNPFNFVPPMDPRPAGEYEIGEDGTIKHPLGQGRPAGHDRYRPSLWSGRIGIEIETVTPLLIPEAKPVREVTEGPAKGHKVFKTRRHGDKPHLPVTTLKGALRSAYEIVTNSRFGVFRGHDAPLARRMNAGEALQLIPGRVVKNAKSGALEVELLMGTTSGYPEWFVPGDGSNPRWQIPDQISRQNGREVRVRQPQYAAWLPNIRQTALPLPTGLKNGAEVTIRLQKVRHNRGFSFWEVVSLAFGHGAIRNFPANAGNAGAGYAPQHGEYFPSPIAAHNGYVIINGLNIEGKHDERVFFSRGTPKKLPVSPAIAQAWKDLILDYKSVYRRDGWNHPGTSPSRHIIEPASENLREGTLCYAKLLRDESDPGRKLVDDDKKQPIVEALYPVMIGRELGLVAPDDMLVPELAPATALNQLSPADRVFGWVRDAQQIKSQDERSKLTRPAAYKGQLRIAPIECEDKGGALSPIETFGVDRQGLPRELPLAILSTPKPSQARFYAASDKSGTPLVVGAATGKTAYFDKARENTKCGLRGRKVYPHQAALARHSGYWTPGSAIAEANQNQTPTNSPFYREYVRRMYGRQNQDSQNRSMQDWVRPGTKFKTHIELMNLNEAELGALLWLLDLPASTQNRPSHHRLGGGKPLGFGSVKIRVTLWDLRNGEARKDHYASLLAATADQNVSDAARHVTDAGGQMERIKTFKKGIEDGYGRPFDEVPFIKAFLVAARGHAGNLPTHYPRTSPAPDPAGENFRWFVANEKEGGHPRGQQFPLGSLDADEGLPYRPTT